MIEGKIIFKKTPVMLPISTVGSITFVRPYSIQVASLFGCLALIVNKYLQIDPARIVNPLTATAYFVVIL